MIKFEWDAKKAITNQKKHGISFEEFKSVFYDEFAVQFYDEGHSGAEHRFLMLGFSCESRILLVCNFEPELNEIIAS
jgi:uncharacterized DUF497 family protein